MAILNKVFSQRNSLNVQHNCKKHSLFSTFQRNKKEHEKLRELMQQLCRVLVCFTWYVYIELFNLPQFLIATTIWTSLWTLWIKVKLFDKLDLPFQFWLSTLASHTLTVLGERATRTWERPWNHNYGVCESLKPYISYYFHYL